MCVKLSYQTESKLSCESPLGRKQEMRDLCNSYIYYQSISFINSSPTAAGGTLSTSPPKGYFYLYVDTKHGLTYISMQSIKP